MTNTNEIIELVKKISNNYKTIINRTTLSEYKELVLSNNGNGDRWAKQLFNYTSIYGNKKNYKTYSENDEKIDINYIKQFQENNKGNKIVGILVHSIKINNTSRPISNNIKKFIKKQSCVICGSNSDIICDHKNDMYNDERVLNITTQKIEDFQALCNHCNLQKRQIYKIEQTNQKLYSAKNIAIYKSYPFEFPWEKKSFDKKDIINKIDTYWYDPIEFNNKIFQYIKYTLPIINAIKKLNINK